MKRILAIVGPTASGKSALALALAKELNGEIISCDSMQVYRGMDVGTAKPSKEEMREVKHHLIDVAEADEPFSSADYLKLATDAVEDVLQRGKLPIFCGGTGLYLDGFLRGGYSEGGQDEKIREKWKEYAAEKGNHALWEELQKVDGESAAAIHENNVKRVIRALEIYESTGIPKSVSDKQTKEKSQMKYDATVIGLRYLERELLYNRIDLRIEQMIKDGLAEETKRLVEQGVFKKNSTAAQAIGYKELFLFLNGQETLTEAAEKLKLATRHYAKRQMTWFSAKDYVTWLDADGNGKVKPLSELVLLAKEIFAREGAT